jgi:signal transduction histidine kinase
VSTLSSRAPDALAVSSVAWLRVGLATAAAASGCLPDSLTGRQNALYVVLGLVWVPWSVVVLFASERPRNRWALIGGPVGDVAALFAIQVLATTSGVAALSGYLVVVAFTAYTVGRAAAGALAAASISAAILAQALLPASDRIESGTLASFALAAAAIVFLLDRTSALQSRASARADRLESTAEAILANIGDGVVVTDGRGQVLTCNPAAERILQRRRNDVLGAGCARALELQLNGRALDCSSGCELLGVLAPDDQLGIEVTRTTETRRQALLVNAAAITDADGSTVEVVHSLRDVTRMKEAAEAKMLFLATASHELKTPLTVIRGFVELLNGEMAEDLRPVALQTVQRRTAELTEIVDRLLLSSRIESGRVDLSMEEVDVAATVSERVLAMATATGRRLTSDVPGDLPSALGDETALATVLDHLLDNAVKYSPEGDEIAVSAEVDEQQVVVLVADRGIGMDDQQLAHCFDKFWQAERAELRRFGGTGIGLYIVRSLMDGMGGEVSVARRVGGGTVFRLALRRFEPVGDAPRRGEATMIGEFMRQIGVPGAGPS